MIWVSSHLFVVSFLSALSILLYLSLFLSHSQCADVSGPVSMLKAPFFSRCGSGLPFWNLKSRLFLLGNKQPFSYSLYLSFFVYSSFTLEEVDRVGRYRNASSLPCPVHPVEGYWGLKTNYRAHCWDPEANTCTQVENMSRPPLKYYFRMFYTTLAWHGFSEMY